MIIATDTETFEEYTGTNSEEILHNNEILIEAGITKEKQLQLGWYYPILNAQKYVLGIIYVNEKEKYIYTKPEDHWNKIKEIHEECKKRKENLYIYGHNHLYDFLGYARNAIRDDPKLKVIIEYPFLAIYDETRETDGRIIQSTYFTDTLFYWKLKLREVGEIIKQPKSKMPLCYREVEDIIPYCTQDCKTTLESIKYIQKTLQTLGFKPRKFLTAGKTAQSTWQTYIRRNNIHENIMHDGIIYKSPYWRETRMAYRGGDIRTFYTGKYKHLYKVDVRGEYAYIMKTMNFPNLKTGIMIRKPKTEEWKLIKECIGIIQCTIEIHVPTGQIPFTPILYKERQYRPYKMTCTGTWTIEELKYAEEIKQITVKEIEWAEVYKKDKTNPFTGYISLLEEIEQTKPEIKPVIKLLRNNLGGKFAQNKHMKDTKFIHRADIEPYLKEGWEVKGIIENLYYIEKDKGEYIPGYTNPLIITLITAGGRIYLHKLMSRAEKIYNCNTDGFIIDKKDLEKYDFTNKGYGSLKLEEEGPTIILENKYEINGKLVVSGIPIRNQKPGMLEKTEIETTKMITIKEAIIHNQWEKLGTFKTETHQIETKDKLQLYELPEYVDETEEYYEKPTINRN